MKKLVQWSLEKAQLLKDKRGIEFEQISIMIEEKKYIDIREEPSRNNQRMFIFDYDNYIICVPFVEDEQKIFLKTAYRSRKTHKLFKGTNRE